MQFFELLLLVAPAFVSNAVPVVFGGGQKLDFGKKFPDGKRIFGDSKTIRGLFSGIVAGTIIGTLIVFAIPYLSWLSLGQKISLAFLISTGAMAGDLLGSFTKRRFGLAPGSQYFLLDQLLFVITAVAFAIAFEPRLLQGLDGWHVLLLLVITYFLHLFFNWLAHKLRLKKVPW